MLVRNASAQIHLLLESEQTKFLLSPPWPLALLLALWLLRGSLSLPMSGALLLPDGLSLRLGAALGFSCCFVLIPVAPIGLTRSLPSSLLL